MSHPYVAHFAFKEPPFSKEIPDADLWLPSSKLAAVESLLDALDEHASVVLVGEPGVGKTCVLRALRHRIPAAGFRLTYCHNATLGRRDFYRQLCHAVGISPAATAGSLFHGLSRHVEERAAERVHPVFLLDEAHLMHQDTLDHLHILLNYAWDSRALLSLVLVGLPELRERLELRRNRSLYSRVHHRLEIAALTPEDIAEYLRMRLHRVGCDREVERRTATQLRVCLELLLDLGARPTIPRLEIRDAVVDPGHVPLEHDLLFEALVPADSHLIDRVGADRFRVMVRRQSTRSVGRSSW